MRHQFYKECMKYNRKMGEKKNASYPLYCSVFDFIHFLPNFTDVYHDRKMIGYIKNHYFILEPSNSEIPRTIFLYYLMTSTFETHMTNTNSEYQFHALMLNASTLRVYLKSYTLSRYKLLNYLRSYIKDNPHRLNVSKFENYILNIMYMGGIDSQI